VSREVIIRIRDDFDGSDADETIPFAYRGIDYEIDFNEHNVELFDKTMKQFIEKARKADPPKAKGKRSQPSHTDPAVRQQRREVRAWANSKGGFKVTGKGLIANEVFDAFEAANPDVEMLPGVRMSKRRADDVVPVVAQDAEDGLISAESLLGEPRHTHPQRHIGACAPSGRKLTKTERDRIRQWCQKHGIDQADTGQLKSASLDAYFAANPEQ